jgi:hypothetical protein
LQSIEKREDRLLHTVQWDGIDLMQVATEIRKK